MSKPKKVPNSKRKLASAGGSPTGTASTYNNVLKVLITLSFVIGTLALTWYGTDYYYEHALEDHGETASPAYVNFARTFYVIGSTLWIATCGLAYLGPYLRERGLDGSDNNYSEWLAGALLFNRPTILWFLVFLPSLWVFLYACYVEIPHSYEYFFPEGSERGPSSWFDWASILVLASALPAGTAGMISMGIYVFGAVARHCPLWSAYLVLPDKPSDDETNKKGCCGHGGHSNLMMEALRIHQWSGYITFWWFFLHSLLYFIIYGFAGLYDYADLMVAVEAAANATTDDADGEITDYGTFLYPAREAAILDRDEPPGTITMFLWGMWWSMYPPPECLPMIGNQVHDYSRPEEEREDFEIFCHGYFRNFNGFLAFCSVLALVLTSVTWVRRKSYRFFYLSHILTATLFVLTMCFHMPRIVLYLFPSLVCYFATTIPTLVQGLAASFLDGGVDIEDWTVLTTPQPSNHKTKKKKKKKIVDAESNEDNPSAVGGGEGKDGVLEFTFLVDPSSGEAREANAACAAGVASYRPKSVRICVPSISLMWYPFTVIERVPSSNQNPKAPVRYTVLLGTVGKFTRKLWKIFHELQKDLDEDCGKERATGTETGSKGSGSDKEDGDSTKSTKARSLPLLLVDGFYSGATDWIKDARSHDALLIGAGGTGVTPFLAFLPQLLSLALDPTQESVPSVSFLWCCRDEALIRHVVRTYLIPLVRTVQARQPEGSEGSSKMRLMIYNTSRSVEDTLPLDLSSSMSGTKKSQLSQAKKSASKGRAMQPARLQYHPRSSRASVTGASATFLSIAVVGALLHLWQWYAVRKQKRASFATRAYGIYAILGWSFIVGIVAEGVRRHRTSRNNNEFGFARGSGGSSTTSDEKQSSMGEDEEVEGSHEATELECSSLEPGRTYSYADSVLELSLSNGRPILKPSGEASSEGKDGETGETLPTPSEVTLSELVGADRPGVFYCGADALLNAIQKSVQKGQRKRRRELRSSNSKPSIANCVYYKESFEM